jgi:hypothetical protein
VRAFAHLEAGRRRCGGVVEFRSITRRTALYELIARHLESTSSRRVNPDALADLQSLMTERPTISDTGLAAATRDRRVAAILVSLERDLSFEDAA